MYRIIVLFQFFVVFSFQTLDCQSDRLVIYTDDTPYLLPFIEASLVNLKDNNSRIFESVTNLSRLIEGKSDQQKTLEGMSNINDGSLVTNNKNLNPNLKQLTQQLVNYDYFLKINVNTLSNLVEYQFFLYKIIKLSKTDTISGDYISRIISDIEQPEKMVSFFIDPSSNEYLDEITLNLKRIFTRSNQKPTLRLYVNGELNPKKIYITTNDKVSLDVSHSFDYDNSDTQLSFNWIQTGYLPYVMSSLSLFEGRSFPVPDSLKISISQSKLKQSIQFNHLGVYHFEVSVFDGIESSKKLKIRINVIERPYTLLTTNKLKLLSFKEKGRRPDRVNFSFSLTSFLNHDLKQTEIKMERLNQTLINPLAKGLLDTLENSSYASYIKRIRYPNPVIIDRKIVHKNTISVEGHIRISRDSLRHKYIYRVYSDYNGVKSNASILKIKYFFFGSNIRFQYINGPAVDDLLTLINEKYLPDPVNIGRDTTISIHFATRGGTVSYLKLLNKSVDLELGFLLGKRLVSRELRLVNEFNDISSQDSVVLYSENHWATFPYLGVGINTISLSNNPAFNLRISSYLLPLFSINSYNVYNYNRNNQSSNNDAIESVAGRLLEEMYVPRVKLSIGFGMSLNFNITPTTSFFLGFNGFLFDKKFIPQLSTGITLF